MGRRGVRGTSSDCTHTALTYIETVLTGADAGVSCHEDKWGQLSRRDQLRRHQNEYGGTRHLGGLFMLLGSAYIPVIFPQGYFHPANELSDQLRCADENHGIRRKCIGACPIAVGPGHGIPMLESGGAPGRGLFDGRISRKGITQCRGEMVHPACGGYSRARSLH